MKRFWVFLMAITLLVGLCVFPASAADNPTVTNVIRISEKEFVIEFSEPIEFRDGYPLFALRIVNSNDSLQWLDETPMQVYNKEKSVEFLDDKHDRVLWRCTNSDINYMLEFGGPYSAFENKDVFVKFCIEEMPPNATDTEDGTVHNIVSVATGLALKDTKTANGKHYDGVYFEIETDYTYELPKEEEPESESKSTDSASDSNSNPFGQPGNSSESEGEGNEGGNLWLWIAIAAGVVVIAAVVIVVVSRKKKKS